MYRLIFFADGSIQLPWKRINLKMKSPGLVMVRKKNNNLIVVYSQPSEIKRLEIDLNNNVMFQNNEIEIKK